MRRKIKTEPLETWIKSKGTTFKAILAQEAENRASFFIGDNDTQERVFFGPDIAEKPQDLEDDLPEDAELLDIDLPAIDELEDDQFTAAQHENNAESVIFPPNVEENPLNIEEALPEGAELLDIDGLNINELEGDMELSRLPQKLQTVASWLRQGLPEIEEQKRPPFQKALDLTEACVQEAEAQAYHLSQREEDRQSTSPGAFTQRIKAERADPDQLPKVRFRGVKVNVSDGGGDPIAFLETHYGDRLTVFNPALTVDRLTQADVKSVDYKLFIAVRNKIRDHNKREEKKEEKIPLSYTTKHGRVLEINAVDEIIPPAIEQTKDARPHPSYPNDPSLIKNLSSEQLIAASRAVARQAARNAKRNATGQEPVDRHAQHEIDQALIQGLSQEQLEAADRAAKRLPYHQQSNKTKTR